MLRQQEIQRSRFGGVIQEEIQIALAGAKGLGKGGKKNNGQNTEMFMRRIQKLPTHLYSSLWLNLPPDILDGTPSQGSDQSSGDQSGFHGVQMSAGPAKVASHDNIDEKAAEIMYQLRKSRNDR